MLDIAMSVVGTVGMVKSGGIKPARWYFTERSTGLRRISQSLEGEFVPPANRKAELMIAMGSFLWFDITAGDFARETHT